MNWLRRFMIGRNGPDPLAVAILMLGMLLTVAASFVTYLPVRVALNLLDYVLLALFFFRVLSRNVYKRREENARFLAAARPVLEWVRLRARMVREARVYRYLRCPACGQRLRVPRGKGKIRVTCRGCREQFERKV